MRFLPNSLRQRSCRLLLVFWLKERKVKRTEKRFAINLFRSFLVVVKAQSSAVDKVQHRLEQLDNFEEGSQRKLDLSQAEYVSRIEQLNRELVSAWNSEQKVKALRIVIQCAKLLADTEVMRFYPSKFVLITDILDIFGQLVYDRLRTKADYLK